MKSVTIVQSGDFHLDSPLALHQLSFRNQRREELLQTFTRIIDFSLHSEADLLLLTGDLFDSSRVTRKTLDFLSKEMKRFSGRIFISPGNHDPYNSGSPYESYTFPENTHIFRDYEEIHLKDLDCLICGQGFTDIYQHENMLQGRKASGSAAIRILVMHGEVTNGSNAYNPISKESLLESGFSYIALGHRHEFSGVYKEGRTAYAYAGIPEGRGFDELGDKGILHGKVYENAVNLSFRKMNSRSYEILEVPITDCHTLDEIKDRILASIESRKNIYRFDLTGKVPPYLRVDLKSLEAFLMAMLQDFIVTDRTVVWDPVKRPNTLQGLFLQSVMDRKNENSNDPELLDEVARLGLRLLSQEDI